LEQDWHLDYRASGVQDTSTIFVAMSPTAEDNCTEVLRFRQGSDATAFEQEVEQEVSTRLLQNRSGSPVGALCVEVQGSQVELAPLVMAEHEAVCVSTARLIHRRGRNTSSFTRLTLNVDYTRRSPEELDQAGFVDDDSEASITRGGLVGQAFIDDLHSEVVVKLAGETQTPQGLVPGGERDGGCSERRPG